MHLSYFQVAAANACNPAAVLQQYLVSESIKSLKAEYWWAFLYGQTPLVTAAAREPGSVLQQSPCAHITLGAAMVPYWYRTHQGSCGDKLSDRDQQPWHPIRASCSSPAEECAQSSVFMPIFFYLGMLLCNEATEGTSKLHHLGGDAEVAGLSLEEIVPTKDLPPPGTDRRCFVSCFISRDSSSLGHLCTYFLIPSKNVINCH